AARPTTKVRPTGAILSRARATRVPEPAPAPAPAPAPGVGDKRSDFVAPPPRARERARARAREREWRVLGRVFYCAAGAGGARLELKMSSIICHFPSRLRHTTMYLPLALNGVVSSKCPRSLARSPLVRTSSVTRSTSAFPIDSNPPQNLRMLYAPLNPGEIHCISTASFA